MSLAILRTLLAHPLTRNLALDDPATTTLRRRIIAEKPFLKRIYQEWYEAILAQLPAVAGPVLEIGSGPGFLKEMLPELITSELLPCPGVRMRLDGQRLPFAKGALRAIVMTDVLHHVPGPERFFEEAARALSARRLCLRPSRKLCPTM